VNNALLLRCGALYHLAAKDFLRETTRLFKDQPSRSEETKYEVRTDIDSQVFAEFTAAPDGRWPEVDTGNVDVLRDAHSGVGFEERLGTPEAFDGPPPRPGVSVIDLECRTGVHDVEGKGL
jgi:hypothetical protein